MSSAQCFTVLNVYAACNISLLCIPSLAMIIGFTSRSQTVSEGDAPPGSEFNRLTIDVAT